MMSIFIVMIAVCNSAQCLEYIEDKEFSRNPFGVWLLDSEISEHDLEKYLPDYQFEKQYEENLHDPEVVDEFLYLTKGETTIIYRSLPEEDLYVLYHAEIYDQDLVLNKGIAIGVSKVEFAEKFKVAEALCDTVVVDYEGMSDHIFYFKEDSLNSFRLQNVSWR